MDQGTKEKSASKMDFEKFLKEQWVIKEGEGLETAQLSWRRMGRWSENEESRIIDVEIGTSHETRNRSKIELEAPE